MKYKIIIAIVVTLIIGFVLGQSIPFEYLRPTIEQKNIETKDYYNLIVQIISAIATFLAVIIALFREEIRSWWEYVKIDYSIPNDKFIEVLNPNIGNPAQGLGKPLEAEKYLCAIDVSNTGTITSHLSEIHLETIIFESKEFTTPQILDVSGFPLCWNNTNEQRITIPPNGKKKVVILELIAPEKESSPEGHEKVIEPQLKFSGVDDSKNFTNGIWKATYLVHSNNCKPKRFEVQITWNGKWQGRKTEMQNYLTIELKNK